MSNSERVFYAAVGGVLIVIIAFALLGAVVALASPEFLDGLRTTEHPITREPRLFAAILLFAAVALAWQMRKTSSTGFIYSGRTEWIYKADEPRLYRLWFLVHLLFVATTAGWSAVAFLL